MRPSNTPINPADVPTDDQIAQALADKALLEVMMEGDLAEFPAWTPEFDLFGAQIDAYWKAEETIAKSKRPIRTEP